MKITDEQLMEAETKAIAAYLSNGGVVHRHESLTAAGRASLKHWEPILLAWPDGAEGAAAESQMRINDGQGISRGTTAANVLRSFVANRLRSLLEKDDPAVEAVREYIRKSDGTRSGGPFWCDEKDIPGIVAAVRESDAARKGAA